MTYPLNFAGRSLVALLLIATGLSTFGCGDSATVTESAALGSLSVSPGKLEPPFNPATTSYIARIPFDALSTTITASPQVSGDTIRFDNQQTTSQTITLASPQDTPSVTIVVTDTGTGGTSRSYSVRVEREVEDTALSALTVSPGTLSPSTFDKNIPNYAVNGVDNTVRSITISATKSDSATVMQIGSVTVPAGTESGQAIVQLGGTGSATEVPITLTAPGGSTNTYTVTINRGESDNNFLRSLAVSSGGTALSLVPRFSSGSPDYTVNVASNTSSVSVTPRLDDTSATMTVDGRTATSGQAQAITLLPAGQDTLVKIRVIAQDNSPAREYSLNVKRAALGGNKNLSALTISPGSLNFNANTLTYTVNVGSNVPSVDVSATKADRNATMSQDVAAAAGTATGRATIRLGAPNSTTPVLITVQAPNGDSQTYRINVVKDALGGNKNLSSLTISPGSLDFSPTTLTYTVNVGSNVSSVDVSATKADPNATMSQDVAASPGTARGQATIQLGAPESTTPVLITVQAPNGDSQTYRINVVKDALGGNNNLQSLAVAPPGLTPSFRTDTTSYSLEVGSDVSSVTVTPRLQDTAATMTVNGEDTNSRQARTVTLNPAGQTQTTTPITIIVTAQNLLQKTYTVNVIRAALSENNNLSDLNVRAGTVAQALSPSFSPNELAYTVNVANTVNEVTVAATKADLNAVMSVGSETVAAGTRTGETTVPVNASPISIAVTPPSGGAPKTYSITVRQGPAAPSTAPDLIEEDDSCPLLEPPDPLNPDPNGCAPGTSRSDNITTVILPRFRITQPNAGETPNLYVDGSKVDSNFDASNNTLQPVAPLSGDNEGIQHSITSTITNTATNLESEQSDALTVTISTGQSGV